jgi:hypothetical protein
VEEAGEDAAETLGAPSVREISKMERRVRAESNYAQNLCGGTSSGWEELQTMSVMMDPLDDAAESPTVNVKLGRG